MSSEEESALSQRSVWGVNPQVVENLIADHRQEVAALRTRLADMESRVSTLSAQRDDALRRVSGDQTAVQNRIVELESRLMNAFAQVKAAEDESSLLRESADRINVLREEAVQVVADAWAMAQAIEERTQQLVARTREELTAEAQKLRAQMEDEKSRHRAEMERLTKQRLQMLQQLEATARGLLDHATLIKGNEAPAELTSRLDLALKTLNADATATEYALAPAPPRQAAPPASPPPVAPPAYRAAPPVPLSPPPDSVAAAGNDGEASTLNNALNELEALLSQPRDRWQPRTNGNGAAPANPPGDDELLHRLRDT